MTHRPLRALLVLLSVCTLLSAMLVACGSGSSGPSSTPRTAASTNSLGKIAYVQDGDIYVQQLPDGTAKRITSSGDASALSWSPSGDWLYSHDGWLVRADGTGAHKANVLSWEPDSDRYAGVASDPQSIFTENADGSGRTTLVPSPAPAADTLTTVGPLSWSPDGRWIAYGVLQTRGPQTPPDRVSSVWRVAADGGTPEQLYTEGDPSQDGIAVAGWSSDGAYILLQVDPYFSASLQADGLPYWSLPATGGKPLVVLSGTLYPVSPDPSRRPSDEAMMAVQGQSRESWTGQRLVISFLFESNIVVPISDQSVAVGYPAFSPDGRSIAYMAMPDIGTVTGSGDEIERQTHDAFWQRRIWVMDRTGTNPHPLTSDPAYRDEYPQWSADSSRILFVRMDQQSNASLWLMNADGSDLREVVTHIGNSTLFPDYYGRIPWELMFAWWRPPSSTRPAAAATLAPPSATRTVAANETVVATIVATPGAATSGASALVEPGAVAVAPNGAVYVADGGYPESCRIVRLDSGGGLTPVAGAGPCGEGGDGGPAIDAEIYMVTSMAVDGAGDVFLAEPAECRVREVVRGTIRTVAGDGTCGFAGDAGPATAAELNFPDGLALSPRGDLFISDDMNCRVREVSGGIIRTAAGDGSCHFSGDGGPATKAGIEPADVALGPDSTLYIADAPNIQEQHAGGGACRVRSVRHGVIETVAGNGCGGTSVPAEGGPAVDAALSLVSSLAVAATGTLYIADGNCRVWAVRGGNIYAVAGHGPGTNNMCPSGGDGGPATAAGIWPGRMAIAPTGDLYIVDGSRCSVRRVRDGIISTVVAGTAGCPA